jgi:hypothetical protein
MHRLRCKGIPVECFPEVSGGTFNFSIGCLIPSYEHMRELCLALPNTKWNPTGKSSTHKKRPVKDDPKRNLSGSFSPSLIIEYRKSARGTARLWKTGSVAILGAATEKDAKLVAQKLCRDLRKQGYAAKVNTWSASNLCGASIPPGDLDKVHLNLNRFHVALDDLGTSEYNQDSGVIFWRPWDDGDLAYEDPLRKRVIIARSKGRFSYVGFKYVQDILLAFEHLWLVLQKKDVVHTNLILLSPSKSTSGPGFEE